MNNDSYEVNFAIRLINNWTKYHTANRFTEMMNFMVVESEILKIYPFLIDYIRNQLDEAEELSMITCDKADYYSNELLFKLMNNRQFKSML
uniref:Uncharacterized protein n=1 Tax=Pithovirus LCPAC404 TaxID=2506597 RepID=A0A481ZD44_9VIRU|nr:MAG: hypothetical protein LCPAC404_00990 [Pithovirus LCPAC404]